MNSDDQKQFEKEMNEAIEKSPYKEVLKSLDYDKVKELAQGDVDAENTSGDSDKSNSSTSSDESSSKVSDGNFDKALDDYDAYVDEYIKFLKKAKDGDASAMSEYPAMLQKAQNMEQSLTDAQTNNNLSADQLQRMLKIQGKLLGAASAMH